MICNMQFYLYYYWRFPCCCSTFLWDVSHDNPAGRGLKISLSLIVINQKRDARVYYSRGSVFNYPPHSKSNRPILPSSPSGERSRYPRRPPIHIQPALSA